MNNPFEEILKELSEIKAIMVEKFDQVLREQQEKYISPEETCKLFKPNITKPTLEAYSKKKILNKYYLGGRTWYKAGEIEAAMKKIKRYSREK